MADQREEQVEGEQYGQDADDRRLGRRALHPAPAGLIGEPVQAVPLVHVGNFKERDPPIFRGLPHEDVVEWGHQFQRVSLFNQWGPVQQLRNVEFSLEGVAASWLPVCIHDRKQLMG
jgi:hypothetical protein